MAEPPPLKNKGVWAKKIPGPIVKLVRGFPDFSTNEEKLAPFVHEGLLWCVVPFLRYNYIIQTGILTPGSIYVLRLPIYCLTKMTAISDKQIVTNATFVPGHSGGPVPDLHRIPSKLNFEHLNG